MTKDIVIIAIREYIIMLIKFLMDSFWSLLILDKILPKMAIAPTVQKTGKNPLIVEINPEKMIFIIVEKEKSYSPFSNSSIFSKKDKFPKILSFEESNKLEIKSSMLEKSKFFNWSSIF